jgi:hypothetical protein
LKDDAKKLRLLSVTAAVDDAEGEDFENQKTGSERMLRLRRRTTNV